VTLLEPAPKEVVDAIQRRLVPDEEVRLLTAADLLPDGSFGSQWFAVTPRRVVVVGPGSVAEVALSDLIAIEARAVVGGGRLELTTAHGRLVLPCSASRFPWLSEVARGIGQLRDGEPLAITPQAASRCERCDRPLEGGSCPACRGRLATLWRAAGYLRPYRGNVLVLAFASVVITVSALLPPLLTGAIVDRVLVPHGPSAPPLDARYLLLLQLALALVGLRLASWAAEWAQSRAAPRLAARVTADVRGELQRRLVKLPVSFHDREGAGALQSRFANDASALQDLLTRGLPYVAGNGLTVLGVLGVGLFLDPLLTLAMALPIPLTWVWTIRFQKRMRPLYDRTWRSWSLFSGRFEEMLTAIGVVKSFTGEKVEVDRFTRHNRDLRAANLDTNRQRVTLQATMFLVTGSGLVALWLVGGIEVIQGKLSLGTLVAFYGYVLLLYTHLQWFGQVNGWVTQAVSGAERIFTVLDTPAEGEDDAATSATLTSPKGQISLRGVSFGYQPGQPVLHDINLDVAPGEIVGIVGPSGTGKTTLINLLCRFYAPDTGSIHLDDIDISQLRLPDLRSQIGVVPQEPFLFSGTVADNISYSHPTATFDKIMHAARVANVHAAVLAQADGYDTDVGESGRRLSVGQRQRIAIARAVLRNPTILILDEATSSIDPHSEQLIQDALRRLTRQRTTFVIAHRLSTLRHVDTIVVLVAGRIVETGSYHQLLARRGHLWTLLHTHAPDQLVPADVGR
jgi:ATP-binding cassette subfamily B protein